jgi:hypothetical protein
MSLESVAFGEIGAPFRHMVVGLLLNHPFVYVLDQVSKLETLEPTTSLKSPWDFSLLYVLAFK